MALYFQRDAAAEPKKLSAKRKQLQEHFEITASDELLITQLSDDLVENVAYLMKFDQAEAVTVAGGASKNPYRGKEFRDMLKYQINSLLRKMQREKKIHLGSGVEKGQREHPLVPYIRASLFDALCKEFKTPTVN